MIMLEWLIVGYTAGRAHYQPRKDNKFDMSHGWDQISDGDGDDDDKEWL